MNVSSSAAQLLRQNQAQLSVNVVEKQLKKLNFTPLQRQASLRDANYNISYLADAIELSSTRVFSGYITWLRDIMRSCGLPDTILSNHLCLLENEVNAIAQQPEAELITSYLNDGQQALVVTSDNVHSFIENCGEHTALAQRYLQALLSARKDAAVKAIMDELNNNRVSAVDLYTKVFTNVLYEIGRLWQTRQISVAQEHFASAVTQYIISLVYERMFVPGLKPWRMMGSCVGEELHEIGIRMVCDIFELSGWDSHYLGANLPAESIISEVERIRPHVLALSATLTSRVLLCTEIITMLRASFPDLIILVGGGAFTVDPQLWRQTGADGYTEDALGAVQLAQKLVNCHA